MARQEGLAGRTLLLSGSRAFRAKLPKEVQEKIEEAMARHMRILVGEAPGACRLYQDYLLLQGYKNVVVGHAKSMRYNAGGWKTVQYGEEVGERERKMIEECDSAIVIWTDNSGVIAENLELLKREGKPTFLYECSTKSKTAESGWLGPSRIYDPFYFMKEYYRNKKEETQKMNGGSREKKKGTSKRHS
jgi:hypothetical protein